MGRVKKFLIGVGNKIRLIWLIVVFVFDWVTAGLSVVLSSNQPDDLPKKTKRRKPERPGAG